MSRKAQPIRMGACGAGEFIAPLAADLAMSMDVTADPAYSADARASKTMGFDHTAASSPFSTLFETVATFSMPSELFWGILGIGGAVDVPLIIAYDHSLTPVKYVRQDDIVLTYTGDDLTLVTKESGDTIVLEYTGADLTKVTNDYLGLVKDLSYTDGKLTGVVVSAEI